MRVVEKFQLFFKKNKKQKCFLKDVVGFFNSKRKIRPCRNLGKGQKHGKALDRYPGLLEFLNIVKSLNFFRFCKCKKCPSLRNYLNFLNRLNF